MLAPHQSCQQRWPMAFVTGRGAQRSLSDENLHNAAEGWLLHLSLVPHGVRTDSIAGAACRTIVRLCSDAIVSTSKSVVCVCRFDFRGFLLSAFFPNEREASLFVQYCFEYSVQNSTTS